MTPLTAQRTLVKSPPELWSELSEVDRLARHLEAFGEIKITKLEPEHTVAWEGEHACGTVSIEPSGWGTKVTFEAALALEAEAEPVAPEPEPEPVAREPQPEAEPEPVAVDPDPEPVAPEQRPEPTAEAAEPEPPDSAEPEPAPRRGFWARLIGRWLLPEERVNQLAREESAPGPGDRGPAPPRGRTSPAGAGAGATAPGARASRPARTRAHAARARHHDRARDRSGRTRPHARHARRRAPPAVLALLVRTPSEHGFPAAGPRRQVVSRPPARCLPRLAEAFFRRRAPPRPSLPVEGRSAAVPRTARTCL